MGVFAVNVRVARPGHLGIAVIESSEFKTVDEVVFAQPGDLALLGARTIEGFNALVDARKKRLIPAGPVPAAAGTGAGGRTGR